MRADSIARVALFATALLAFLPAHLVADHWVQTQHQADTKGLPGWPGRLACAAHVTTYTATLTAAFLAAAAWLRVPFHPGWLAAGLAVSAITHYFADRRTPLRRIAYATGSGAFWEVTDGGMNGRYLLDQAWHIGWLFVAALLTAAG